MPEGPVNPSWSGVPSVPEARPRRASGSPVVRYARAACVAVAAASLGGLVSPWLSRSLIGRGDALAWAVDLAAHWQWLFTVLLAAGVVAAVALGGRRSATLLLALPLPWLSAAPPLEPAANRAEAGESLAVASANVYYWNRDPAPLRAWLDEIRPDILVIVEINHRFARALEGAGWQDYPHRYLAPRSDAFGLAVLSRHPLETASVWRDRQGVGVLLARVAWRGRGISLAGFHPMTPQSVGDHLERNRVLDCLTPASPGRPGRTIVDGAIVAGDFNATPWSVAFAGPTGRGWRRATGLSPTWPEAWHGLMGIPIDHVLANDAWRLVTAERGPDIGSDHLPVVARLRLAPETDPPADAAVPGDGEAAARTRGEPIAAVTSCLSRAPANARSGA